MTEKYFGVNTLDEQRQISFDQAVEVYATLQVSVEEAGAHRAIIHQYLNRPLKEFLAQVCAPNGVRFYHKDMATEEK